MKFAFHPHGYEFHPVPGPWRDAVRSVGQPDQVLVVSFEMTSSGSRTRESIQPRSSPKYPDRWTLMHVKDLAKEGVGVGTRSALDRLRVRDPEDVHLERHDAGLVRLTTDRTASRHGRLGPGEIHSMGMEANFILAA